MYIEKRPAISPVFFVFHILKSSKGNLDPFAPDGDFGILIFTLTS